MASPLLSKPFMKSTVRNLFQKPLFSATVVLTLAIGIAANVLIFSILYAVLFRPLPYIKPNDLFALFRLTDESGQKVNVPYWSYPKYELVQKESRAFDMAAYFQQPLPLQGDENSERMQVEFVTPNYFSLLGIRAEIGRTLTAADDHQPVALISRDLWQRRFQNSTTGGQLRALKLERQTFTIIGVLPREFRGQSGTVDIWLPMKSLPSFTFPRRLQTAYAYWHEVIARRKQHNVSPQTDLDFLATRIRAAFPPDPGTTTEDVIPVPLQQANVDPRLKDSLLLLFGAVGLVLLIACVNVANMIWARSISRKKEIAIRVALGATRKRIVLLLVTEAAMLAFLGGSLAIVFAVWGTDLLTTWLPESQSVTGWQPFRMFSNINPLEYRVLSFALGLSCFTAVLVGVPVALRFGTGDAGKALKEGIEQARGISAQKSARLLVAAEVALSIVLLICAGLLIKSFWKLQSTNVGIQKQNVLTFKIDYPRDFDTIKFQKNLLERLTSVPDVQSVAVGSTTPLSARYGATTIRTRSTRDTDTSLQTAGFHIVSGSYFKTLGIPLHSGRSFTDRDRENTPWVAIINETAAKQFWPDKNPIGERIRLGLGWEPPNDTAEIIGVVGDVQYGKVEAPQTPDVYLHYLQPTGELSPFVMIRSKADSAILVEQLRSEIRKLDASLPLYDIKTMEERIGDANSASRFAALVLGIFAGIALLLAGIGIFAVTSYTVAGRRKEIAIRMALGSSRYNAIRESMLEIGRYVIAGTILGVLFALVTTRLMKASLYGIAPGDPITILVSAILLSVVSFVACYLPVRRATAIDPMRLLKYE
jgi:putative ABC transport system permease protein